MRGEKYACILTDHCKAKATHPFFPPSLLYTPVSGNGVRKFGGCSRVDLGTFLHADAIKTQGLGLLCAKEEGEQSVYNGGRGRVGLVVIGRRGTRAKGGGGRSGSGWEAEGMGEEGKEGEEGKDEKGTVPH